jgi:hypothetical protein
MYNREKRLPRGLTRELRPMSHLLLWKVSAAFLALFPKPPFVYGLHWAAAGPQEPAAAVPAAAEQADVPELTAALVPPVAPERSDDSSGEEETLATRKQHSPLPPLFEAL